VSWSVRLPGGVWLGLSDDHDQRATIRGGCPIPGCATPVVGGHRRYAPLVGAECDPAGLARCSGGCVVEEHDLLPAR
jgi:hypothetical protein